MFFSALFVTGDYVRFNWVEYSSLPLECSGEVSHVLFPDACLLTPRCLYIAGKKRKPVSGQLIHILYSYKWVDADEIVEILVVPKNWEIL